jgi:predicted MFS family arabinose efflux permease
LITKKSSQKNLTITILSLSLLTVMAGAAVAPALDTIRIYFSDANQTLTQMIISIPALFIVIMSFIFPKLCLHFRSKGLLITGLILYVAGGSIAGIFSNIYIVLFFRSLVGIGVGIIMPLSTGLLSFYYTKDKQDKLMGYSSAMNQLGGVISTLIAGLLASVSWRLSFLVYLIGLISIVFCVLFLPNERISEDSEKRESGIFVKYYRFIIAMFLLMFTFFIYPTEFAIETSKEGIIPQHFIAAIMAGMDFIAFLGGLSFIHIKKCAGHTTRIIAPILFILGYTALWTIGGWTGAILGSFFIGFANGLGIPYIISTASVQAGKSAAVTVMPLLSMSLYLAQFTTPLIISLIASLLGQVAADHLPYFIAIISAILFTAWSFAIKCDKN